MLNFEIGKVKLISNTTSGGSPIELPVAISLIIRNSDTGLYWDDNDTFISSPFLFTMIYDSIAKYYYYTNSNLVLKGLYEAIFISDNIEMPFREVEQFLLADTVANSVWDEILTGNNHNDPTSAGRRLRSIASVVITQGQVVSSTLNTVTLNGDAETTDGAYDPAQISIINGKGRGQNRGIYEYVGATRTAILDRNWKTLPDATSEYIISAWTGREHVNEGLARGGTINTITLNALASSKDDAYIGQLAFIRSGTGDDQVGHIIAYDGTTKVAIIEHEWSTIPDNTSAYVMIPFHALTEEEIAIGVWNHIIEDSITAEEFMRIFLGILSGITTVEYPSGGLTRVTFKSIDGLKDRAIVEHEGTGVRSASTLDGS